MKNNKHEIYLLAAALVLTAVLIIYNALSAPELSPAVISYDVTNAESTAKYSKTNTLKSGKDEDSSTRSYSGKKSGSGRSTNKGSEKSANFPININTASKEELVKISGIGETRAQEIIDYRNKNGNFNCIGDIVKVRGIGDATFQKIKPYITVN